jgi:cytochrome c oxidase subunit IV
MTLIIKTLCLVSMILTIALIYAVFKDVSPDGLNLLYGLANLLLGGLLAYLTKERLER